MATKSKQKVKWAGFFTIWWAGQIERASFCEEHGIGHLQTGGHSVINGTFDLKSNLKSAAKIILSLFYSQKNKNDRKELCVPLLPSCEGSWWSPRGKEKRHSGRWLSWWGLCCGEWGSVNGHMSKLWLLVYSFRRRNSHDEWWMLLGCLVMMCCLREWKIRCGSSQEWREGFVLAHLHETGPPLFQLSFLKKKCCGICHPWGILMKACHIPGNGFNCKILL